MNGPDEVASVRAQVWVGGTEVELRTFPMPSPEGAEAVVAVDLATVCTSDVHTVLGRRDGPCPGILGHEAVGRIAALGPEGRTDVAGTQLRVGDRVVWGVTASCGSCDRCSSGRSAKCRRLLKTGHESLDGPWPLSGCYASHLVLHPGVAVVRVPAAVADRAAALASCAVATVMASVEAAGDLTGRRVVVSGLGMLGIVGCAVARAGGASSVEGFDPDQTRRALAERHGADVAHHPADLAAGGADVVLELSGSPSAVAAAIDAADVGGRVVLAGSVAPAGRSWFDPELVVRRHLTIVGVHNYEPHHLVEAVAFLERHDRGALGELVAAPVSLEDLPTVLTTPTETALRRSVAPSGDIAPRRA